MVTIRKYFTSFILSLICIAGSSQTITLATYQYGDNNRLANIEPLARHLENECKITVLVKSYPTVHSLIQAIQNNELDIALINTFGYLLLDASGKEHKMKPYFALEVKADAKDNYKTAIVASNKIEPNTINGLKSVASGLRLCLVNIGSTSGNLVPRLAFNSVGLDRPEDQFALVDYGKNHKSTIDAVLEGKADVCAVGSSEYFDALKDSSKASGIKLLWLSPEIPLGPVLIHDRLKPGVQNAIKSSLRNLHSTNPAALEAVKKGWTEAKQAEKFVEITGSYYGAFANGLGSKASMKRVLEKFTSN